MTELDYYAVLGVDEHAPPEVIKAAYHALARKYHPDLNSGTTELGTHFQEIAHAYEHLSAPQRRAAYDLGRNTAKASTRAAPVSPTPGARLPSTAPVIFAWKPFCQASRYLLQIWLVQPSPGQVITATSRISLSPVVVGTRYTLVSAGMPKGVYHWRIAASACQRRNAFGVESGVCLALPRVRTCGRRGASARMNAL